MTDKCPCCACRARSATGMAAFLSSIGTDWLLKRAFKFLLKRNLGCLLRNEVRGYAGALH